MLDVLAECCVSCGSPYLKGTGVSPNILFVIAGETIRNDIVGGL
jgi:hypothetical protein